MNLINNDVYSGAAATAAAPPKAAALGQADFMRLMTEQLKHQDPLKPLSNSEFIGQLAQFSTVQGIGELKDVMTGFGNALTGDQVLKGASLVGHSVLVPSAQLALPAEGETTGLVMTPGKGTVSLAITDSSGAVVRTVVVESTAKGEQRFAWDGLDDAGQRLPPGTYAVAATHVDAAGGATSLSTYVDAVVESVTIGSDGLYLNLPGLGTAPLDYVLRVGKSST